MIDRRAEELCSERGSNRVVSGGAQGARPGELPIGETWLTPTRLVILSVGVGAAALTDPALRLIAIRQLQNALVAGIDVQWLITLTTVWLSVTLARRAMRSENVAEAAARSVLGGIFFGALNAGLALVFLTAASGHLGAVLAALFVGVMFGGVFCGGPLGFVYGVLFAPLIGAGVEAGRRPSHQGSTGLMLWAGTWLGTVGLVSVGLSRAPYLALSWAALLLGIELVVIAMVQDLRLAGFVGDLEATLGGGGEGRADAGERERWRVLPRGSVPDAGVMPLWPEGPGETCDGVLVASEALADGPYRETWHDRPVALVPREIRQVRQAAGRRAAAGLLVLLGLLWAALAMLA